MTKAEQEIALKKKRTAAKAKRTRNANMALAAKAKPKRRRKRTPAKKGFLSDFGSVQNQNTFKSMLSGAVGGGLYLVYEDQVSFGEETSPERKLLFASLGAYAFSIMGKRPNTGAGIMGAAAYDFF